MHQICYVVRGIVSGNDNIKSERLPGVTGYSLMNWRPILSLQWMCFPSPLIGKAIMNSRYGGQDQQGKYN